MNIALQRLGKLAFFGKLVSGSASSIALRGLSIASSIAAVSLALRLLGPERYGQYVLLMAASAWLGLGMLGTGDYFTKSLVKVSASAKDRDALSLERATLLYCTIGAIGGGLVSIAGLSGLAALGLADRALVFAGLIILIGTGASSPLFLASSALVAEGRIALDATLKLLQPLSFLLLVAAAYVLPALSSGTMLIILSAAYALSVIVTRIGAFMATFSIGILFRNLLSAPIGSVARGSFPFLMIQVASMLSFQTDRFLVSSFSSLGELASYDLLVRIFGAVYTVFSIPLLHIWRLAGASWHEGNMPRLKRVVGLYSGGAALFWVVVTLGVAPLASVAIRLFSGASVAAPAWQVTVWVGTFFLIRGTTDVLTLSLFAMEQEKKVLPFTIAHGVTNVVFAAAGGAIGGIAGLLIGQVVSFVVSTQVPFLLIFRHNICQGTVK